MADDVANLLLKITGDEDDAEQSLKSIARKLQDFDGTDATATAGIDADSSDFDKLRDQLKLFDDSTYTAEAAVDTGGARVDLAFLEREAKKLDGKEVKVEVEVDKDKSARVEIQAVAEALQGLLKHAVVITVLGFAAQGVGALAAAFFGLAGAIAPASGALAAMPALLSAVAQGVGVLKLGLLGVRDSVKKAFGDELTAATPGLNNFQKFIKGFVPEVVHLKNIAQGPILRGLTEGIKAASGNFGLLNPIIRQTANAIGGLLKGFGEFVGSPAFGKDLTTLGQRNVKLIKILGQAAGDLGKAFIDIIVAVGPLVMWLARLAASWAASASAATAAGRSTGSLAGFFEKTRATLERLGSILGGVWRLLVAVGRAGQDFGNWMLDGIGKAVNSLADLAGSAQGQKGLKAFFESLKPAVNEIGKLIVDIGKAFIQLATQPGLESLAKMLRTELLPALVSIVATTTESLGPALIKTFASLIKLLAPFVGTSGPLIVFVKGLGAIAEVLAVIITKVPGLSTLLVSLLGLMGTFKASLLLGRFTGFTTLVRYLGITKTTTDAATLASTRHRAAELLSAAAARTKAAAVWLAQAATAAYTAITNGSAAASFRARAATIASTAVLGAATVATWLATAATTAFGAAVAILTSPIFLVVAAIAALIAIGYLVIKNWDDVKSALGAVWDFLKDAAGVAFGLIKKAAEIGLLGPVGLIISHWGAVKAFLGSVWNFLSGLASSVWNSIKSVVSSTVGAMSSAITSVWNAISGFLTGIWDDIKTAASAVWGAIKSVIGGAASGAVDLVRGAFNGLKGVLDGIWDGIKGVASSAWGGIKNAIVKPVEDAVGAIRGLAGSFRSAGAAIINAIKDGIVSAAEAVYNAVKSVIQKAKDLLPGSEPKDPSSPLRRLGDSGRAIVENLAAGIPLGADRLTQVLSAELAALPIANLTPNVNVMGAGAAGPTTINRHYHLPPGPSGGLEPTFAAAQLDNLLRNEGALTP